MTYSMSTTSCSGLLLLAALFGLLSRGTWSIEPKPCPSNENSSTPLLSPGVGCVFCETSGSVIELRWGFWHYGVFTQASLTNFSREGFAEIVRQRPKRPPWSQAHVVKGKFRFRMENPPGFGGIDELFLKEDILGLKRTVFKYTDVSQTLDCMIAYGNMLLWDGYPQGADVRVKRDGSEDLVAEGYFRVVPQSNSEVVVGEVD